MERDEIWLKEYEQIQSMRGLFSGFIMDWLKIMVPVGGAIFTLFSFLTKTNFRGSYLTEYLPLLGWLVFIIPLFTWRIVAHHIRNQITVFYPRLIELERNLDWHVHAAYFLNSLNGAGWNALPSFVQNNNIGRPERRNYHVFKALCEENRRAPHDVLLESWDAAHGYQSIRSRGHAPQDWAVFIISCVTLLIAAIISFLSMPTCNKDICSIIVVSGLLFICILAVFIMTIWPRGCFN